MDFKKCLTPGVGDKMLGSCPTTTYLSIMHEIYKVELHCRDGITTQ